ncbi:MAG TPA: hypothetical protein PK067_08295, partial [Kaistella chaponensis]|nr:hypothetical protein [Kaistella chaponensis]
SFFARLQAGKKDCREERDGSLKRKRVMKLLTKKPLQLMKWLFAFDIFLNLNSFNIGSNGF